MEIALNHIIIRFMPFWYNKRIEAHRTTGDFEVWFSIFKIGLLNFSQK